MDWSAAQGGFAKGKGKSGGKDSGSFQEPTPTGETYYGTIKSISAKFGFIECADLQAGYGCDCFCLGRQLANFQVGQQVEFEVGINAEGKPQAISVTAEGVTSRWNDPPAGGMSGGKMGFGKGKGGAGKGKWGGGWDGGWGGCDGWGGGWGDWSSWGGADWWGPLAAFTGKASAFGCKGKSKGKSKGKEGYTGGVKRKPEETGETYTGTVKSSSFKFGFIQSEEIMAKYGCDCFCLAEQLQGYNVGDAVIFEVGVNTKGQPQATNVLPADMESAAAKRQRLG